MTTSDAKRLEQALAEPPSPSRYQVPAVMEEVRLAAIKSSVEQFNEHPAVQYVIETLRSIQSLPDPPNVRRRKIFEDNLEKFLHRALSAQHGSPRLDELECIMLASRGGFGLSYSTLAHWWTAAENSDWLAGKDELKPQYKALMIQFNELCGELEL